MNEKPCLCPLHPTSKKKIRIHKSGNLIIQSIIKYNIDRYSPSDQPKTGPKNQSKINSSTHFPPFLTHSPIYHPPTLDRTLTPPSKQPPTRSPCQTSAPNVDMCRGSQHACCHQPPVQTTTTTHVIPPTSHRHATTQSNTSSTKSRPSSEALRGTTTLSIQALAEFQTRADNF